MHELEPLFRTHQLRLSAPRREVFTLLAQADAPLSLATLRRSITHDRTSLYRTLQLFVRLGIVDVITVGWKKRYELAEPFRQHHHHVHCEHCGEILAIDTPRLERHIELETAARGYILTRHQVEIYGICPVCQQRYLRQVTTCHNQRNSNVRIPGKVEK
ncbi:hypothetical protein CR983_00260 [Candidatus Saccharibacteria bacterium]|nr:MAG: hypothetical protein CR983_00260 [Candidatus Saccharibacteria bacterium]